MQRWKGTAAFVIIAVIVIYHVGVGLSWFPAYWETVDSMKTTAKEAYSIASSYALAGEPQAYLGLIVMERSLSDDGKALEWRFVFCAPDGRYIVVYVNKHEVTRDDDPSEAWEQATIGKNTREPLGEWVDTPVFVEDAFSKARKSLDDQLAYCIGATLSYDIVKRYKCWRISIIDHSSKARGRDYYYNITDGSLIDWEALIEIG